MTTRAEIVWKILVMHGYSVEVAKRVAENGEFYLYENCNSIGDIAKAVWGDEVQALLSPECIFSQFITIDWDGMARELNKSREMYVGYGYGIAEVGYV